MKIAFRSIVLILAFSVRAEAEDRTIQFAGITWNVREGRGGPCPNRWSKSKESVWVDDQGQLHLKIRRVEDDWYCAEVWTQESFGYGDYVFQVVSNVERYDDNVVVGLFVYRDDDHEIDIEFSRWGVFDGPPAQYVIQPYSQPGNLRQFRLNLRDDPSTHLFRWRERSVVFQSYRGLVDPSTTKDRRPVQEWTCTSRDIPKAGTEKLHINFWLNEAQPPADGRNVELIIKSVKIKRS